MPLPSPSSTGSVWCWAEPGNCRGFVYVSLPAMQLQSKLGGRFRCEGPLVMGLSLKATVEICAGGWTGLNLSCKAKGKVPCAKT